ncbi:hypothetical protein AvCA_26930 [Azotobacter vinelandii CA]|uniref:Uncharacterized protein n=2 Tax=Azotobacter vinelandii TaxID=354 RepID=C1DJU9_AZOVD|nr:hypothetical protein Avin_26930 [Azotobacter vinelandii DJ]AGK14878.1 hypothetical protein AvCA_26930 [Azotobacter vinelandii CA]AGK20814.1 hypothetical protein AvCA6_26930 [Azotobacter vinelandii CA6]
MGNSRDDFHRYRSDPVGKAPRPFPTLRTRKFDRIEAPSPVVRKSTDFLEVMRLSRCRMPVVIISILTRPSNVPHSRRKTDKER